MSSELKCKTVVTVQPPPQSELQYKTHWGCCAQSFWLKTPDCIGVQQTGTCLCCTGAFSCRLGKWEEADACNASHGSSMCCSLKGCKEEGPGKTMWCQNSGTSTCCWLCLSKSEFVCRAPTTCCKCAVQECCCEYRIALPCDEDVPCGCSCCGKYFKPPAAEPTGWNGVPDSGATATPAHENMS